MMMGTAGELPKPPEKPTQFLEDMTDAQVAEAVRMNDDGRVRYTRFVGDSFIHCIAWDSCWFGESWQHMLHGMYRIFMYVCVYLYFSLTLYH